MASTQGHIGIGQRASRPPARAAILDPTDQTAGQGLPSGSNNTIRAVARIRTHQQAAAFRLARSPRYARSERVFARLCSAGARPGRPDQEPASTFLRTYPE